MQNPPTSKIKKLLASTFLHSEYGLTVNLSPLLHQMISNESSLLALLSGRDVITSDTVALWPTKIKKKYVVERCLLDMALQSFGRYFYPKWFKHEVQSQDNSEVREKTLKAKCEERLGASVLSDLSSS